MRFQRVRERERRHCWSRSDRREPNSCRASSSSIYVSRKIYLFLFFLTTKLITMEGVLGRRPTDVTLQRPKSIHLLLTAFKEIKFSL